MQNKRVCGTEVWFVVVHVLGALQVGLVLLFLHCVSRADTSSGKDSIGRNFFYEISSIAII